MPRTSPNRRARRGGEAGFTVLESALALAVVMGVALAALEVVRSVSKSGDAAKAHAETLAAAESAMARIGADLPARPGRWEIEDGGLSIRVDLTPFVARAQMDDGGRGFDIRRAREDDPDDENKRPLRGAPLLATVSAELREGGANARVRLARIVLGPLDEEGSNR